MVNLLILILAMLTISLWLWALMDISKSTFYQSIAKIFWFFIVIIFPALGSILYFQLKKRVVKVDRRRLFRPLLRRS